jgi:glycosyltransferase involved in cell wall biosynthesis
MHEGALIGWVLSKLTGAPMIFDFQGSLTGEMLDHRFITESSRRFKFFRGLEGRINHMARVILTSSRHAAGFLKNEFGISPGRVHPTPDCVDTDTFHPNILTGAEKVTLKDSLGIPQNKQLIVYAGLLAHYQGTEHLLRALHLLKIQRDDFHLLLMGFPNLPYYQALTSDLGISDLVTFTGKIPYESLPVYLALGDIATAPKLSATEGCGKILNYMSMALPTVTYNTLVSQEFLGPYGIYARERTFESLGQALNQALDMPLSEQRQLGQMLRQRAGANYNWEKIGRQVELLYKAVLAGHPQPASVLEQALTTR